MKIKDGDFMWLGDAEGTIDWAVVYNGNLFFRTEVLKNCASSTSMVNIRTTKVILLVVS